MPAVSPPDDLDGAPVLVRLEPGTPLWRIHGDGYPAHAVNAMAQPTIPGGARFDSLDGGYAFTYVGDSPGAAVAEVICRDLPVTGHARLVPRKRIERRWLSRLTLTAPLTLIALYGAHLAAVGQDTWLKKSEPSDYVLTRRWAAALFAAAPTAAGVVYRCRHNEDRFAWMLKTEPTELVHPVLASTSETYRLESPSGIVLVEQILQTYNATLSTQSP